MKWNLFSTSFFYFSNSYFIQTTLVQEISRFAKDLSLHVDIQLFIPYEK